MKTVNIQELIIENKKILLSNDSRRNTVLAGKNRHTNGNGKGN